MISGPGTEAIGFFGLVPDGDGRWVLPVERPVCSGTGALFGGAAIGAAVAALEAATGRSLVWITVQFVAHVRPPARLDVAVRERARGRHASQAELVARCDGSDVFAAMATLGDRPLADVRELGLRPPKVPRPERCRPRVLEERHQGGFMERTEARLARAGKPGSAVDGRSAVWARIPGLGGGTPMLAALGDYVGFGVRQAFGTGLAAHSLDNSLRVLRSPPAGWVLADIVIEGVADGFGQGHVHLWDEGGRLLATASQSFACRRREAQ